MRQGAWSLPLSHCSPYLKIKTRKLCLKDFTRGSHNPRLPLSCVCVNSLINIAGKDHSPGSYCVSRTEEGGRRLGFLLSGRSPPTSCILKKKSVLGTPQSLGPGLGSQRGDLCPRSSGVWRCELRELWISAPASATEHGNQPGVLYSPTAREAETRLPSSRAHFFPLRTPSKYLQR